ncbi:MAG: hypothetical protein ACUZ77_09935, partial [Candidatus Brocadiales bacterium]
MKTIRQSRMGGTCLFFVLSIAIYSLQIGTAWGQPAVSYTNDIQPLFTTPGAWFDRNLAKSPEDDTSFLACGQCHFDTKAPSFHMMDLTTHAGTLNGSDGGEKPILGESEVGATDYDWDASMLRRRLRDNRMPPDMPFNLPGAGNNRNGPDIVRKSSADDNDLRLRRSRFAIKIDEEGNYEYGSDINAVGLIKAWVEGTDAGLRKRRGVPYDGVNKVKWRDIKPFFTKPNTWYNGSLACASCHYCNTMPPCFHAMDLSSPAGLRGGSESGSVPILGESTVGSTDFSWDTSMLRRRLRNNRMPPN